jgi:hypothetical protein
MRCGERHLTRCVLRTKWRGKLAHDTYILLV